VRQQRVALAFDERPILAGEAVVLAPTHFVEGVVEVPHDVELVVNHPRIGDVLRDRVEERLPHIHGHQLDAAGLARPQPLKEEVEIFFAASATADPDRTATIQVADDDAVVVPLADRDLVHADNAGSGDPRSGDLLRHVDLVEVLHGAVMQSLDVSDRLVGHLPAQRSDVHRVALRIAGILRQPFHVFYKHCLAPWAVDPPAFELDVDAPTGDRQIPDAAGPFVVATPASVAAAGAGRRFFRRQRMMTRANRSPKTPRSFELATKPGSENSSRIDVGIFIRAPHQRLEKRDSFSRPRKARRALLRKPFRGRCYENDPLKPAMSQKRLSGSIDIRIIKEKFEDYVEKYEDYFKLNR